MTFAATTLPSNSATASLRWRARVAKEALLWPFDDSSSSIPEDDVGSGGIGGSGNSKIDGGETAGHNHKNNDKVSSSSSKKRSGRSLRLCHLSGAFSSLRNIRRPLRSMFLPLLGAIATAVSVMSLTVSSHMIVAVASALNVALSILIWMQHTWLKHGGKVQQSYVFKTRNQLHKLQTERERLYRTILTLDKQLDRKRDVQRHIKALWNYPSTMNPTKNTKASIKGKTMTGSLSAIEDIMSNAIHFAHRYSENIMALQLQFQSFMLIAIAQVLVDSENGESHVAASVGNVKSTIVEQLQQEQQQSELNAFDACNARVEAILTRLQCIRGVSFNASLVRDLLRTTPDDDDDNEEEEGVEVEEENGVISTRISTGSTRIWTGLILLLRQVIHDYEIAIATVFTSSDFLFPQGTDGHNRMADNINPIHPSNGNGIARAGSFSPSRRRIIPTHPRAAAVLYSKLPQPRRVRAITRKQHYSTVFRFDPDQLLDRDHNYEFDPAEKKEENENEVQPTLLYRV